MGISVYNLKRWFLMLIGNSIYHVDQGLGKAIELGGYYNDLTQKVLRGERYLDSKGIPFLVHDNGQKVQMATMVFQYGLGAYDLWLLTKDEKYLQKAKTCADWAVDKQNKDGSWNVFGYIYPDYPYSAMTQGEGVSLLLRVYRDIKLDEYIDVCQKAINFMLLSVEMGGVSKYDSNHIFFLEFTNKPIVLNGLIFAIFGLYDYTNYTNDKKFNDIFNKSILSLTDLIPQFDAGYWSKYAIDGKLCSPFYHKLHIAQMKALYLLTKKVIFKDYSKRWSSYNSNVFFKSYAFLKKAYQKIME